MLLLQTRSPNAKKKCCRSSHTSHAHKHAERSSTSACSSANHGCCGESKGMNTLTMYHKQCGAVHCSDDSHKERKQHGPVHHCEAEQHCDTHSQQSTNVGCCDLSETEKHGKDAHIKCGTECHGDVADVQLLNSVDCCAGGVCSSDIPAPTASRQHVVTIEYEPEQNESVNKIHCHHGDILKHRNSHRVKKKIGGCCKAEGKGCNEQREMKETGGCCGAEKKGREEHTCCRSTMQCNQERREVDECCKTERKACDKRTGCLPPAPIQCTQERSENADRKVSEKKASCSPALKESREKESKDCQNKACCSSSLQDSHEKESKECQEIREADECWKTERKACENKACCSSSVQGSLRGESRGCCQSYRNECEQRRCCADGIVHLPEIVIE